MNPEEIRPLHNRIIVKRIPELRPNGSKLIVVRENPELMDFIGQGDNGQHDDNRRIAVMSQVVSVGSSCHGVAKGDITMHTAWNDFPAWFDVPKEYCLISENDVMGHVECRIPDA